MSEILYADYIQDALYKIDDAFTKQETLMETDNPGSYGYDGSVCGLFRNGTWDGCPTKHYGLEPNPKFKIKGTSIGDIWHYLTVCWLVKRFDVKSVDDLMRVLDDTTEIVYPVGGEIEWDLENISGTFWKNINRWHFLELIRDELEFLLRNGVLRNDLPAGIYHKVLEN